MNTYAWRILKKYKYAGKYNGKHQYTAIVEADMVSTTDGLTGNSLIDVAIPGNVNKPIERNLLN